jgi:hypothetical protein
MLSVRYKPFTLSVVTLNVVMLNVVMLNVVMLNVVVLNVVMLNVVLLSVLAPAEVPTQVTNTQAFYSTVTLSSHKKGYRAQV